MDPTTDVRRGVQRSEATDVHVLAIQTAPRPQGWSLERTLMGLEAAGLQRWRGPRLLVADGRCPFTRSQGWIYRETLPAPRSSMGTFRRLLQAALEVAPDLTRLTVFEDDVAVARNVLGYIDSVVVPDDVLFISWFSTWLQPDASLPRSCFIENPTGSFRCGQALTIPRLTIDLLLLSKTLTTWPISHGRSRIFAKMCGTEYATYLAHYPSIVQHTEGLNSACGPRNSAAGERKAPTFVGEDFDVQSFNCEA